MNHADTEAQRGFKSSRRRAGAALWHAAEAGVQSRPKPSRPAGFLTCNLQLSTWNVRRETLVSPGFAL
jgi:hypothetical protein